MKLIARTGLYADRLRFLGAVAREVPRCLDDLAGLLTPPRLALLAKLSPSGHDELLGRPWASVAFPAEPWWWGGAECEPRKVVPAPAAVDLAAMPRRERAALLAAPAEVLRRLTAAGPGSSAAPAPVPAPVLFEVAELNAAVAAWAGRWNLARDGAGGWVLAAAGLTLIRWADHGPLLARTVFEFPPHVAYLAEQEPFAPFTSAGQLRARTKQRPGAEVELLVSVERWHLAALARWQVGGDGATRAGRRWAELERRRIEPDAKTVREKLRGLATRLDLPSRPKARPGRRRVDGR